MNLTRYSKAIVALIWAGILLWNTLLPDQAIAAGQADVERWINTALALMGPLLVYAVPNRG